jgi:hypothetical protein
MIRALDPLEQEVKRMHMRRDQEKRKRALTTELMLAHDNQAQQVRDRSCSS